MNVPQPAAPFRLEDLPPYRQQTALQTRTIASLRNEVSSYATKLGEQGREIGRLMSLVKEQEALIASLRESAPRLTEPPPAADGSRFRSLRALIVKELQPDHAPDGSVDRALRAETFKAIWPEIEAIANRT